MNIKLKVWHIVILSGLWVGSLIFKDALVSGIRSVNSYLYSYREFFKNPFKRKFCIGDRVKHVKSLEHGVISDVHRNDEIGERYYVTYVTTGTKYHNISYDFELVKVDPETAPSLQSIYGY